MSRKTFLPNREKLYYFLGRQQYSITESKCFNLFIFLEAKWKEIEKEYEKKNKGKDQKDFSPINITLGYDAYKKVASDLTTKLIMAIGTDRKNIKVLIIERNALGSLIKQNKKLITVKEASELANKTGTTIRNWIKNNYIKANKVGKSKTLMIDANELKEYLKSLKKI